MQLNLFILALIGVLGSVTLLGFGLRILLKGWKGKLSKPLTKIYHLSTEHKEAEPLEPTIEDIGRKLVEKKAEL